MDQNWIQTLLILVFCQQILSLSVEKRMVKEGQSANVRCFPNEKGALVMWFRVLDVSGMQFIGSFTTTGFKKQMASSLEPIFKVDKAKDNILTVNSFNKTRDSGLYSCASVVRNTELSFGQTTRLVPEEVKTITPIAPTAVTKLILLTTRAACICEDKTTGVEQCSLVVLGSLAGGCGLLLLILIITILYCNRIRTRRCPHHYKRKPRPRVPGK